MANFLVSPGDEWTATNLFPKFEKLPRIDFFVGFFPSTKHGREICLSTDTYMANREWRSATPISPCNDWEGGRDGNSFHYSAYYYSHCWSESHSPLPITQRMY